MFNGWKNMQTCYKKMSIKKASELLNESTFMPSMFILDDIQFLFSASQFAAESVYRLNNNDVENALNTEQVAGSQVMS